MYEKLEPYISRAMELVSCDKKTLKRLMNSRQVYEELTGKFDEDDPEYESRMRSFNEWFLFDFLTNDQQNPFMIEFLNSLDETVDDIKDLILSIRYSFFECRKSSLGSKVILEDFLKGKKYRLPVSRLPFAPLSSELFTGRVLEVDNEAFLFEGIRWLPKEIKAQAIVEAKKIRKKGDPSLEQSFIFSLEMVSTRCRQFKHLSPVEVIESVFESRT